MTERRDKNEILSLAYVYLPMKRCIGGHITHESYVCSWCKSDDPGSICFMEKVRRKDIKPSDYKDPATRKKVESFEVKS